MRLFLIGLACLLAATSAADERILEFNSRIDLQSDGALIVTESITVRAEGAEIRRGIYRDFPTRYRDRYGNRVNVRYEPLSLTRNDQSENFFHRDLDNGVRTYFGQSDRMLTPGVHRYDYRYRVERVIGFFDGHDELYWNVTGNDWAFPIDSASATVSLQGLGSPEILEAAAYTGRFGEQGDDYEVSARESTARFRTTRTLAPHEGLTVVVTWPKGHVEAPGGVQRLFWLLDDNANLLTVVGGLGLMLAYLVPVWRRFGRDPEEGVIVTRYEPPENLPPASLRFIRQMYYDNKTMTTAIVGLAVKGYLRIDETGGSYTLRRSKAAGSAPLAPSEKALLDALFEDGDSLLLDDAYHERIGGARKKHRAALGREYRGRYFRTNGLLNVPALIIAIVTTVIALRVDGPTWAVIAGIALMFVLFAVFALLMKRPTTLGRRTLDEVLGFRDYLDIAEKDELNLRNPPEKTPQLFEAYLPYALALGVEQAWAERFAAVLAGIDDPDGGGFRPSWYGGNWSNRNIASMTSSLSSGLSSSIRSSATPPGSSSGSSGGGFSGGGGGGGGGGGW